MLTILIIASNENIYPTPIFKPEVIYGPIEECIDELRLELNSINEKFNPIITKYEQDLQRISKRLIDVKQDSDKINLLITVQLLRDSIGIYMLQRRNELTKVRYLKGIQIIKILYEKTLALDHHFTSITTFKEIEKMSNPNNYSEFNILRDRFKQLNKKKQGLNLTKILENNLYTSILHSFITLFHNRNILQAEKLNELKKIECIMDFTLRMHTDLNVIYFETVIIKKNNDEINEELEELFKLYTQPIGYSVSLARCRENDDWSSITTKLNMYVDKLNLIVELDQSTIEIRKKQVDIIFPIERLIQFLTQYNAFINHSTKFYEKFIIMLKSYENEGICISKLSVGYHSLKQNILTTSEKFITAYKPVEVNGSKLKQLLYGISEYD